MFCWQSITETCACRHHATSAPSAILEASGTRVNMDSPNTARPITTQYRPPASWPSIQVSTLWAKPARWKAW